MANKFQIDIVGRDKTGEAVKSAREHFEKLTKGTEVGEHLEKFNKILDRGKHLAGIGKSLLSMGDNAAESAGGVGEAAGSMEMLAARAGVAVLGVVGVGAALVSTTGAAYEFEEGFTKGAAATGRFAKMVGVSVQELQAYEIAGEKVGVTTQAMDAAFQNVGNTFNNVLYGRGTREQVALLARLGIQVHKNSDGSIDAARAMNDLANAMVNGNAQTKQMIASQFGLQDIMAFLLQNQKERNAAVEEGRRSLANLSQAQMDAASRFQTSVVGLEDHWKGFLTLLSTNVVIPWLQPAIDGLNRLEDMAGDALRGEIRETPLALNKSEKPEQDLAHAGVRAGFNLIEGVERMIFPHMEMGGGGKGGAQAGAAPAPATGASGIQAYFMKQGWTPAQAAGIAANLQAESKFNPRAIGDHGLAVGIGQWHPDRQRAFAQLFGHDIGMSSLKEQLAFVQHELTQGSRRTAGDRLRQAGDARTAGAVVSRYYEGPADVGGEMAKRGALADRIYADNGGKPAAAPSGAPAGAAPTALASNDKPDPVPSSTVSTVNGAVHVDISMRGAPPGTVVSAQARGAGVTATARIAPTMAGSA